MFLICSLKLTGITVPVYDHPARVACLYWYKILESPSEIFTSNRMLQIHVIFLTMHHVTVTQACTDDQGS